MQVVGDPYKHIEKQRDSEPTTVTQAYPGHLKLHNTTAVRILL